nr:serine protease grass-like [Drosophila takahashii]
MDIALLRMTHSVQFTDYIRPICLLINEPVVGHFNDFKVTGWGQTDWRDSSNGSRILQTATVIHRNRSECSELIGINLDAYEICAGNSTSDSCKGDGGSPLSAELKYGPTSRVFQFGIVSYGTTFCQGPSVYTNVTHQMNWIKDTILENSILL